MTIVLSSMPHHWRPHANISAIIQKNGIQVVETRAGTSPRPYLYRLRERNLVETRAGTSPRPYPTTKRFAKHRIGYGRGLVPALVRPSSCSIPFIVSHFQPQYPGQPQNLRPYIHIPISHNSLGALPQQ